jgi:hypothetical protein
MIGDMEDQRYARADILAAAKRLGPLTEDQCARVAQLLLISERCRRMAADTAGVTVEQLEDELSSKAPE